MWTACACYSCSSFAVMCAFFWAFLTRSQAILSEHLFSLTDLALTSNVPFIFHFLIMFLTVEIGILKHWESFCSLLPLGGNEPSHPVLKSLYNCIEEAMVVNNRQSNQLDTLEGIKLLRNKTFSPGMILTWPIEALTSKSPGSGP